MHYVHKINDDIFWVGGNDRRTERFENMFPLPDGVTYNSYFISDEKTALLDTASSEVTRQYVENVQFVLKGRNLDYLIINHMEPDHCHNIDTIFKLYPNVKIVGNKKTFTMINQFFDLDFEKSFYEVKEGEELNLGKRTLKFFMAPMVHWPEVMVTYDQKDKILFSADAFGSFGAISGNLIVDGKEFTNTYLDEARRYYANIVGKYGTQVSNLLKKAAALEIKTICSLHGHVWNENLEGIFEIYSKWSNYQPEEKGVLIAYGSMYGNTENLANILAGKLADSGVKNIKMYDVSKTHVSYIIADAFKFSNIVFASPSYNAGLYFPIEALIRDMIALNLQNRKLTLLGNGSWAPSSLKVMSELVSRLKNNEQVGDTFEIWSSMKDTQWAELEKVVSEILNSLK